MKLPSNNGVAAEVLTMGVLLSICGCGRPPCFEGALEIQILETEADVSTCSFDYFPAGKEWLIRTTDKKSERRVDGCVLHQAIFFKVPDGVGIGGFGHTGNAGSFKGSPVVEPELLGIGEHMCLLDASSMLTIDKRYDDFESAYEGHRNGDDGAFYVNLSYHGRGTCAEYFPGLAWDARRECVNVHRANVALFRPE